MGEIKTKRTGKFIHWWTHAAFGASLLVFLMLIISPSWTKTLLSKTVTVNEGESVKLDPVDLRANSLGALRVDAEAQIQTNQWATFEIQLLDQNGKIIAAGTKEGWRETGTWYEDGESGYWDEGDTLGGLDVRAKQDEKLTVAIALLEYGTADGKEINQSLPFQVTVQSGILDVGYFWLGGIGSLIGAIITMIATGKTGKKVIRESMNDSDPTGRGTLGGANRLVRVKVDIEADETAPGQLQVCLFINDEYGEQIYADSVNANVTVHKSDGRFKKATAKLEKYFILPQRGSYGFHAEVSPDMPIDKTVLTVRDGARTLFPVEVIEIGAIA